jgi:hypothetical protein
MHTEYEATAISAETRLWKAVLWRAFDDLFYKGIEHSLVVAKKEARKWFYQNKSDFKLVCLFASYEPEYVRDKFYKLKDTKGEYDYSQPQVNYLKQREKYLNDNRRRFKRL